MVRSHRDLVSATASTATTSTSDDQRVRRLHGEAMRLIRQYSSEEALTSTLMLCQTYGFVDGFFFAGERLGRYQLLMNWCFQQRDGRRLLEVCKRCGPADQTL